MDWANIEPDEYKLLPIHYTPGRESDIWGITLHHNAGDLSIQGCYDVWMTREASAHYQVDRDGRVGQLVNDCDTAWACGNWYASSGTISIEHANNCFGPWTIYPKALESGAHLTAALCVFYKLGRPEWMGNVFPHSHWSATGCPGEIAGSQNIEYMTRAQYWYDVMTGKQQDPSDNWVLHMYTSNGTDAQKFFPVYHEDDTITLVCKADNRAVDVSGANANPKTVVQLYTQNGTKAQRWKLVQKTGEEYETDAPYEIVSVLNDDLVLDVQGASDKPGTRLWLYQRNGTKAQEWYILDNDDGTWTLVNNAHGAKLCLDCKGGGK